MQVTRNNLETAPGPEDWFTGAVFIDTVAVPSEGSRLAAASVHFAPGARTAWHSHPNGDSRPSREDRMAWLSGFARCKKETKLGAYSALIFSDPEETNWVNPQVDGWVLDVAENGDPRLTDATLKASL